MEFTHSAIVWLVWIDSKLALVCFWSGPLNCLSINFTLVSSTDTPSCTPPLHSTSLPVLGTTSHHPVANPETNRRGYEWKGRENGGVSGLEWHSSAANLLFISDPRWPRPLCQTARALHHPRCDSHRPTHHSHTDTHTHTHTWCLKHVRAFGFDFDFIKSMTHLRSPRNPSTPTTLPTPTDQPTTHNHISFCTTHTHTHTHSALFSYIPHLTNCNCCQFAVADFWAPCVCVVVCVKHGESRMPKGRKTTNKDIISYVHRRKDVQN